MIFRVAVLYRCAACIRPKPWACVPGVVPSPCATLTNSTISGSRVRTRDNTRQRGIDTPQLCPAEGPTPAHGSSSENPARGAGSARGGRVSRRRAGSECCIRTKKAERSFVLSRRCPESYSRCVHILVAARTEPSISSHCQFHSCTSIAESASLLRVFSEQ